MAKKTIIEKYKVCDKCGQENKPNASACASCKGNKFAPDWIIAKKPINRQVSVDITLSNPAFGKQQKRITLSKWWPGGKTNFNLPNPQQWESIRDKVESFYHVVGWESADSNVKRVQRSLKAGQDIDGALKELAKQHPELILKIGQALNPEKLAKQDVSEIVSALIQQAEILGKGTAGFRESYVSILKKLPTQGKRALEQLEYLLENWSLQQITTVAQTIKSRLDTLELFRRQIENEKTFEIRGDKSIHRILENAMWMIDERYFLLKSNKTLRNFIGKEMSKKDKEKYGDKRPDFVCGSVGDRLIIVELKRPSKTLNIEDLNQLETYLTVLEAYTTKYRSHEAYLMGNKQDEDLIKRSKFRSSIFKIWTYTDLIDNTETRYEEFLKHIQ